MRKIRDTLLLTVSFTPGVFPLTISLVVPLHSPSKERRGIQYISFGTFPSEGNVPGDNLLEVLETISTFFSTRGVRINGLASLRSGPRK